FRTTESVLKENPTGGAMSDTVVLTDAGPTGMVAPSSAVTAGLRKLWLAGLGVVAIAGEQTQRIFQVLEQKGEQLEPSITTPLIRASEAAGRAVERAGASMKGVQGAIGDTAESLADAGRRFGLADVRERIGHVVDERVAAAMRRLNLPTRDDIDALSRRVDELLAWQKERGAEGPKFTEPMR